MAAAVDAVILPGDKSGLIRQKGHHHAHHLFRLSHATKRHTALKALVFSVHDCGPALYAQSWFGSTTCYTTYNTSGCQPAVSLANVWYKYWAYLNSHLNLPIYIGEFGTGNNDTDLFSTVKGSQGQWFTDLVNFIQNSNASNPTAAGNYSGFPVTSLNWTNWALNGEDSSGLLNSNYNGLANANKEYSLLCYDQEPPFGIATIANGGLCGSSPMGSLPAPQ